MIALLAKTAEAISQLASTVAAMIPFVVFDLLLQCCVHPLFLVLGRITAESTTAATSFMRANNLSARETAAWLKLEVPRGLARRTCAVNLEAHSVSFECC